MAHWSSTSESGILRKNKCKENPLELLVFGYACKLFRDDEKALHIDQGKHLIPWMGDDNLKIDRYDGRGALSDLRSYEASREGFDAMRWLGLSDSERKLEELCDKERYYALEINEEEEEMYKEEEQKRQKTNAIQYSYDVPMAPESTTEPIPTVPEAEDEEEFKPPPELDVPVDIEIPKTVKENARIEKTALFVSKQGPQMEILIKAKQADNPQFSFLNQGDPLYKYYKHILSAFKTGRYKGQSVNKNDEKQDEPGDQDSSGHYLHPSLLSTSSQSASQSYTSTIPAIPYKPSANCAYSQLVNRIQGNNQNDASATQTAAAAKAIDVPSSYSQMSYEQQQYYQYYYTSQYYEYYKQLAQYQQNCAQGDNSGQMIQPPDFQLEPSLQNYLQHIAYTQYMQHHHHQQQQQQQIKPPTNNSYAQIVSNVNRDGSNPYAANVPSLPQNIPIEKPIIKPTVEEVKEKHISNVVEVKKPLLSLAQYGSDSENDEDEEPENVPEVQQETRQVYNVPTGEKQIVIDKMAVYVSKNGDQFEEIVKAKGDPRFEFLNETHEYHQYYREKVKEYRNEDKNKISTSPSPEREVVLVQSKPKERKIIAPVSFSIKKTKEEQPKEIKSALPLEESDEEEVVENSTTPTTVTSVSNTSTNNKNEEEIKKTETDDTKNGIILDNDDPILEMIDLTDDSEERKDAKRAEDRIKDKIAAAAREKLAASVNRDKALQLERKKKLAAFLKLKNVDGGNPASDSIVSEYSKSEDIVKTHRKSKERSKSVEKRSHERDKRDKRSPKREVVHIDSESDDNETKKAKKSSKKKKTHKRKHSRSKHDSKSKKKSKKRRRRSNSSGSDSSSSNS